MATFKKNSCCIGSQKYFLCFAFFFLTILEYSENKPIKSENGHKSIVFSAKKEQTSKESHYNNIFNGIHRPGIQKEANKIGNTYARSDAHIDENAAPEIPEIFIDVGPRPNNSESEVIALGNGRPRAITGGGQSYSIGNGPRPVLGYIPGGSPESIFFGRPPSESQVAPGPVVEEGADPVLGTGPVVSENEIGPLLENEEGPGPVIEKEPESANEGESGSADEEESGSENEEGNEGDSDEQVPGPFPGLGGTIVIQGESEISEENQEVIGVGHAE